MKISDQVSLSLRNLGRRKGRTALTVVGIVMGTCLVVVMISLGIAQNQNYEEMLSQWGELTQIEIYGGGMVSIDSDGTVTESKPVELDDAGVAALTQLDHVVAATPYYQGYRINGYIYAGRNDRYQSSAGYAVGLYTDAMEPMGFTLTDGEWLSDTKDYGRDTLPVLVCGGSGYNFEDTRRDYSSSKRYRYQGQTDANGNEVPPFVDVYKDDMKLTIQTYDEVSPKTKSWKLKVVGTLAEDPAKGWWTQSGFVMRIQDLRMLEQAWRELNGEKGHQQVEPYDEVYVKVDDVDNVEEVTEAIHELGFTNTYSISDQRERMQAEVARSQLMLGGLAAVSLLVAALNIANTMTMAIYERTREIGIMKVLGCELGSIRGLFLFESGCLGLLGGTIGVVLSLGISALLNNLTTIILWLQSTFHLNIDMASLLGDGYYYMGDSNTLSVVPVWLLVLALAFATVIGLIFGIIPANRAVKISALEAIRHD